MALPKFAYFEGQIVPFTEAKISIATHAFNYGTGIFAGVRAYWNEGEQRLYLFRPYDHYRRFLNSAKIMLMDFDHTPESLTEITRQLLQREGYQTDVYIRPLGYKAELGIGVKLHGLRDEIAIFALPFGSYVKNEEGVHVTISSWRRIDDNMIPARGKIVGAYANSALIKSDALRAGFDEALVLTESGHVSEGSAMNLFMVRNGVLITPPVTDNILEGITRRSVMTLAREELGLPVEERSIDRTELFLAEELFLTGTAAQIAAVTQVDHRPVGDGQMGEITRQLRAIFEQVVRGKNPKYAHWNVPV